MQCCRICTQQSECVCVGVDIYALTTWYHNISQSHGGLNVLLKGWLHKLVVLFDDALDVSAPLCNVPPQSPHQADVRVRVHKDLHVQQLTGLHETEKKIQT